MLADNVEDLTKQCKAYQRVIKSLEVQLTHQSSEVRRLKALKISDLDSERAMNASLTDEVDSLRRALHYERNKYKSFVDSNKLEDIKIKYTHTPEAYREWLLEDRIARLEALVAAQRATLKREREYISHLEVERRRVEPYLPHDMRDCCYVRSEN